MAENEKSYWIKSGVLTLLDRISLLVFGFLGFILLIRIYDKTYFGYWVLFLSLVTFFEVGRNGLIQNGLVKFLTTAKTDDERGRISTASMVLNVVLSIVNVVLLLIIAPYAAYRWDGEIIKDLIYIYTITTLVMIPMQHFIFVQIAHLDFKGPMLANFIRGGVLFVFIAFLFVSSKAMPLTSLAYVQIIGAIGGSIVSFFFARKYYKFSKEIDWAWVSKLLKYGSFTFLTNLSTMLYKSIDKWMLGALLSSVSVALYEICMKVNNLLEAPTQAIAQIVFPKSAQKGESEGPEAIKTLYESAVGAILAIVIPAVIFIFLFPKFVVLFIGGTDFVDAVPILTITVFYALFLPFANQFGTILDSIGKPQTNLFFTLLGALINIVSNYFFIVKYGVIGAAYGTITTYVITFILNQIVLNKMFKVNWWRAFMSIPNFYVLAFGIIFGKNKVKTVVADNQEFSLNEENEKVVNK